MHLTEKQRDNLEMALVMWTAVDPESVDPGLGEWFCGTHACFGGHLATWEYFIEQGVNAYYGNSASERGLFDGEPVLQRTDCLATGTAVSRELFGEYGFFSPRGSTGMDEKISRILGVHACDPDCEDISDHELVLRRIELALFGELEQRT